MKTLISLIPFLFWISVSTAQDFTLPKSNSTIFLHSGKAIKTVTLWRIDSVNVEYVIKGNLADVKTMDVSRIETPEFLIEFDRESHILKKEYDLIILYPEDTLRGFIQEMDGETISYLPKGKDKKERVKKDDVKRYVQHNTLGRDPLNDSGSAKKDVKRIIYQTVDSDDRAIQSQDSILADVDYDSKWGNAKKEVVKGKKMNELYYHQSYDHGVMDAFMHYKDDNWDSPFLSVGSVNAKVKQVKVPFGMDEKSYRDGYEGEIVKRKAKRATATGTVAKVILLIIIIASL